MYGSNRNPQNQLLSFLRDLRVTIDLSKIILYESKKKLPRKPRAAYLTGKTGYFVIMIFLTILLSGLVRRMV
jgi:hypothetical protein